MRFKAITNKGKIRSSNEDNYYVNQDLKFFMVADGMGGHAAGEIASGIAVEVSSNYDFDLSSPLDNLKDLTYKINKEILNRSKSKREYQGMGTTFAAAIVKENNLYYVNLGDSRIYLYDKLEKKLKKISKDHSLVANLLREGKITEEEAFNHPKKNIVTQALGLEEELELDSGKIEITKNNYLFLCTDGLTDMIRTNEINDIFDSKDKLENLADELLNRALKYGGSDNITLIVAGNNEN